MFLSLLSGTITMDLSVIQKNEETLGVQRFDNQYGSHVYNHKDTFTETDVKGNNNLFHSLKTENSDHGHDPSSLFQGNYTNEKNTRVEASPLIYSSLKRAIDLRVHNRTIDGGKRTIFEDADYFAKNFCYKLLPISFENVDETIIHIEHNYSLFSLCSESEAEEDCSRTMDYSQIKEKNYKRRRTKFREGSEENDWDENGGELLDQSVSAPEESVMESVSQSENSISAQPLDLSSHLVQEKKTDRHLREHPTSIVNSNEAEGERKGKEEEEEEDKENLKSKLGCIEVTITRPDEKENYQPCDIFLNDIARLVPRLIEKDCSEIDILDRTCDRRQVGVQTHRLYYIISESTWELFQSTNERIILTNDESLGEPVQRRERVERPTFLVFDQFSLAKCLADYCHQIGGCFEYTFLEATKSLEEKREELKENNVGKDPEEETEGKVQLENAEETRSSNEENSEERKEEKVGKILPPQNEVEIQNIEAERPETEPLAIKPDVEEKKPENESEKEYESEVKSSRGEKQLKKNNIKKVTQRPIEQTKESKPKRIPPQQPNPRIRTRSKSTSESEAPNSTNTSQKSDKGKRGRSKEEEVAPKEEPNKKRRKVASSEVHIERKTRSGKCLYKGKTSVVDKRAERKSSEKRVQRVVRRIQNEETMSTRLRSRKDSQGNDGNKRKPSTRRGR